ncbi:MAG: TonB-dependent receptor plug domain-containing protein [Clostridiales bacterium]|nr:TonB-dependent receptor plug domain-containing protein [Clostridiales bacterium]
MSRRLKNSELADKRERKAWLGLFLCVTLLPCLYSQEEQEKKHKKEKIDKITEEIIVVGEAPRDTQVSTVTIIESEALERRRPLDLGEAIKRVPGVHVTVGEKNEFTLKLRGMDSRRIALFIDGVPSYEPYFNTFDLKTIEVASARSIQVTRGPASVLYGPNTLGGIVNVVTRRPAADPTLTLQASYGENRTRGLGLFSGWTWKRFSLSSNFLYQDSAGFYYSDRNNGNIRIKRANSDYQRLSLNAKLFYTPSSQTEILVNGSFYHSAYGLPPSLVAARPRYWRFRNWDRLSLSAGGYTALGRSSTLRFRAYMINYDNILDAYRNEEMTILQFESTFDNAVYGLFALADLPVSPAFTLKASFTVQQENARTQDDKGLAWQECGQGVTSLAVENHFSLSPGWTLIAGASFDHLRKFEGPNASRINPLAGLKFSPHDSLEVHFSFSRKSRFPSMRSLYSFSSGNPGLLSESGNLWEVGATWTGLVFLSGAVFFNRFNDMIESVRLPDGSRRFYNINQASIDGLEIQASESSRNLEATLSYTYLDHLNKTENRPLDALPKHNLSIDVSFSPFRWLNFGIFGILASSSSWYDLASQSPLRIPGFCDFETVLSCSLRQFDVFIKASNILNRDYFTEPGFPCRGRTLEVGFKAGILGKS